MFVCKGNLRVGRQLSLFQFESKEADTSSAAKKPRTDRWIAPCTSGYTPTTLYITFLRESIH